MLDLEYQLNKICERNRDGAHGTQKQRRKGLRHIARELHELGFKNMQSISLRKKHIDALVAYWEKSGITVATVKNRMSFLRWWAQKIGKTGVVPALNEPLGIPRRKYVCEADKSIEVSDQQLLKIDDPFVQASVVLQKEFGLRRKEAIKIIPSIADDCDRLVLSPSWTKGGKQRTIPITTIRQRAALDVAKAVAKGGSLIPPNIRYAQQVNRYEYRCRKAGIRRAHGLRHAFAQKEFEVRAGFPSPHKGGPGRRDLTANQKLIDAKVRKEISEEMGHHRPQITSTYFGR